MTVRNLDALLAPASVAIVGASERPGSVGSMIVRNILAAGFGGEVHLVNPKHARLFGRDCHPSLDAIRQTTGRSPDLAVIATPAPSIAGLVAEVTACGCRAAAVITAGLDAAAKQAMLDAARPGLVRILGPNSIGLMLPNLKLNASFAHRSALPGDLAFLSQSGALVTAVIDWACDRGIGFSHVISLGDMADVDFGDMLDYLASDTKSRAILVYMEALTHAPKFMSAARRAARAKPVIVIKSGRNAAAAKAAQSHTGRLAGQDAAYGAAFRRAGVLRVNDLAALFEAAEVLARVPRLAGERLAILTNGGGAGVLAADHLADHGGLLAELEPATLARLDGVLPAGWSHGNPVDVVGDAGPERYAAALEALLADSGTDTILAIDCPTALSSGTAIAEAVVNSYDNLQKRQGVSSGRTKTLLTNWLGEGAAAEARSLFATKGIATFDTPGAAVGGFMQLVEHARAQAALMRTPTSRPADDGIDEAAATALIGRLQRDDQQMLSEADAKSLLAAYGIAVAASIVAATANEVGAAAAKLLASHDSVVVKILSPDLTHKSDVGGVQLGLATAEAAALAAREMQTRIAAKLPEARLEGFTVSAMIRRPAARELIVGMSTDATFGPLLMFGAGGTAVEVIGDTALALPPLDVVLAKDLVARTRISRLLKGYRDRKPADIDAIADALVRLSAMVCQHREILEVDINPLLADDAGVIALDARIRIAGISDPPRPPLVVHPYPTGWEKHFKIKDAEQVLLRPIRPDDAALYPKFFEQVTMEDRRLRFFSVQKELPQLFVARLTQIDYAREIAFVALAETNGDLLGVARFAADPDYERAEYAVLLRSDLKGLGLGWLLMRQLIDYATATGVGELFGSVLVENTTMLRMCRELGFEVAADPDDDAVKTVTLRIRQIA